MDIVIALIGVGLGFFLGKEDQRLVQMIKDMGKKIDDKDVGATLGTYGEVNRLGTTQASTGITQPKTPEQLEWELQENLRKANQ